MSSPNSSPHPIRDVLRSMSAGLLWIGVLFSADLYDSYWRLEKSARKVRTDKEALAAAKATIVEYLDGVIVAYLILAVLAGVLLHLLMGIWFPRRATLWRWAGAAVALCTAGTLAFYSHDLVWFPLRNSWFPWREWYADHMNPHVVLACWGLLSLGMLGLSWRRWAGLDRRGLGARVLGLVAVVGAWVLMTRLPSADEPVDNEGVNIVIIGVDGLRPDHLAAFGYDKDTAPHIEAFLEDAVVFDAAWTVFARTYPSWTSILSGQMPIHHGIRDNLPTLDALVPTGVPLLPQVLAEQGYRTTFVTDDSRFSYMVPETGFQDLRQPAPGIQNLAIGANEPYFRLFGAFFYNALGFKLVPIVAHNQAHGRTFRPMDFIEMSAGALADASQEDRFLYALHTCVLHAPGDRPWPWHQMYGQAGFSGPNRFHYNRAGTSLAPTESQDGYSGAELSVQDDRLYDSGLDMADKLVGRLMGDMEAAGLLDNTIVILLSDHGEESWSPELPYGYYGPNHGFHPFGDAQHRILLGVRFPDGRGAGKWVQEDVRTTDIVPSLAEVLDIEWETPMDGTSFMNLVDGETEDAPRPVYIETGMTEKRYWSDGHANYPWKGVSRRYRVDAETNLVHVREEFYPFLMAAKDRVYQVGPWKLVWRPMISGPAVVQLFRRDEDPLNLQDVGFEHPEKVAELGLALAELLAEDDIVEPRAAEWAALLGVEVPAAVQAVTDAEEARLDELYKAAIFMPPLLPTILPLVIPED
jgi:arylsulfatase A-like enzyme